jgi:adenine/guanine phosphoribosyltransferase-like PRPP-binding protein
MTVDQQLTAALRRTLEKIAAGYANQLGPQAGGIGFAVLASMLEKRGLVRVVKRRDGTRPYALTAEGRGCLARLRIDAAEAAS